MSAFVIFCTIVAVILVRMVKSGIKAKPDDVWTPAKEVDAETAAPAVGTDTPAAEARPTVEVRPTVGKDTPAAEVKPYQPVRKNAEKIFGLAGKPLAHSTSMLYFKKKFRTEGISADYCNFELDSAGEILNLVENDTRIAGLNVTIPYKTDVIPYLDNLDDTAKEIGAVNVIKVERNGGKPVLTGYNTDYIGFGTSLKPMLPEHPVKALILGTGGAAKAVRYALEKMGIESRFVSRTSTFDILGYYELSPSIMEEHKLIVNCTPLGMSPDKESCPDIPYAYLTPEHILFDLIYNPETTMFLQKGIEHNTTVKNGAEMLRIQAEEAWRIWNS